MKWDTAAESCMSEGIYALAIRHLARRSRAQPREKEREREPFSHATRTSIHTETRTPTPSSPSFGYAAFPSTPSGRRCAGTPSARAARKVNMLQYSNAPRIGRDTLLNDLFASRRARPRRCGSAIARRWRGKLPEICVIGAPAASFSISRRAASSPPVLLPSRGARGHKF